MIVRWAIPCCAAILFTGVAAAQPAYPVKQIRLIVGFAPGGGSDILSRALAQRLSIVLGQPVVIDNRPGAGGAIGAEIGAKAPPDKNAQGLSK